MQIKSTLLKFKKNVSYINTRILFKMVADLLLCVTDTQNSDARDMYDGRQSDDRIYFASWINESIDTLQYIYCSIKGSGTVPLPCCCYPRGAVADI